MEDTKDCKEWFWHATRPSEAGSPAASYPPLDLSPDHVHPSSLIWSIWGRIFLYFCKPGSYLLFLPSLTKQKWTQASHTQSLSKHTTPLQRKQGFLISASVQGKGWLCLKKRQWKHWKQSKKWGLPESSLYTALARGFSTSCDTNLSLGLGLDFMYWKSNSDMRNSNELPRASP